MESGKLLMVEDEPKIADALKQGFSENGYVLDTACDGNMGWMLFQQANYHLIILDLNLPCMNGYELCKQIRVRDTSVPIIMLTALHSLENKIAGYNAGADDYLDKPFEFSELLMKVRVMLKRSNLQPSQNGALLSAAGLQMDLDKKLVVRDGQIINLTEKEFQLLEYLLRHKNKVLSRAEIALHVWNINFDTNTNVIDVYINYLRNKVDKPFRQKLIYMQVGMGYILSEKNAAVC